MILYKPLDGFGVFLLEKGKRMPKTKKVKVVDNIDDLDKSNYRMFYTPNIHSRDYIVYWEIKQHFSFDISKAKYIFIENEDFIIGDKHNFHYNFVNCKIKLTGKDTCYIHKNGTVKCYVSKDLKEIKNVVILEGGRLMNRKGYKKMDMITILGNYFLF